MDNSDIFSGVDNSSINNPEEDIQNVRINAFDTKVIYVYKHIDVISHKGWLKVGETNDKINLKRKVATDKIKVLSEVANIISWNIFQMDGIKYVIPMSCKHEITTEDIPPMFAMLGEKPSIIKKECPGCKYNDPKLHNGKYVTIMDWSKGKKVKFVSLISKSN